MQAMILAAGFGTRLLPYTRILPKPLFPILNKPLLLATIERLQNFGFTKIVVNCHHLRDKIVTAVADLPGVYIQQEEQILGTGGGLRRALDLMDDAPLLITNGDIYHTVDLRRIYQEHLDASASVTMALHDCARFNSVQVEDSTVTAFDAQGEIGALAFTGIHVIDPQILINVQDGVQSCIIDLYRKMLEAGEPVNCCRTDGAFWTDMGTPADYLDLHGKLLTGKVPIWPELIDKNRDFSQFLLAEGAAFSGSPEYLDWVCIGNAKIGKDCRLRQVVVWDNAVVSDRSVLERQIII